MYHIMLAIYNYIYNLVIHNFRQSYTLALVMYCTVEEYTVYGLSIGIQRNILCYYWSAVAMHGSDIGTVHYIPSTVVVQDGVAPAKVKTFFSR